MKELILKVRKPTHKEFEDYYSFLESKRLTRGVIESNCFVIEYGDKKHTVHGLTRFKDLIDQICEELGEL